MNQSWFMGLYWGWFVGLFVALVVAINIWGNRRHRKNAAKRDGMGVAQFRASLTQGPYPAEVVEQAYAELTDLAFMPVLGTDVLRDILDLEDLEFTLAEHCDKAGLSIKGTLRDRLEATVTAEDYVRVMLTIREMARP